MSVSGDVVGVDEKCKSVKRQADNVLVQHYYIIIIIKYDT